MFFFLKLSSIFKGSTKYTHSPSCTQYARALTRNQSPPLPQELIFSTNHFIALRNEIVAWVGVAWGFDGFDRDWIALKQSSSGEAKLSGEPAETDAALDSSLSSISLPHTD